MALKVYPLDRPLELEGTRCSAIPYLGYVEVNLQIPGIKGYNEDILLLVILTTTYSKKVPVVVGSKITDRAMGMNTKEELVRATMTWKQAHFVVVMPRSFQLPHRSTREDWDAAKGAAPSITPDLTAPKEFSLDNVQGVCLHHTEGHHSCIWDGHHTWQHRCLRALHVGPHACQASMGPPTAYFCGFDCCIRGITTRLLLGANLLEEPECPPHCNPCQSSCL